MMSRHTEIIEEKLERMTERRAFRTMLMWAVLFLIIAFVVFHYVIGFAVVKGHSMVPSMQNNDFVILNRLTKEYKQGDIIAINMPGGEDYVKRIVGLPGDVISINSNGTVSINGEVLEENYVYSKTYTLQGNVSYPLTVGENELFVMGDNREHSTDSRAFGCIEKKNVIGKVMFRIGFGKLTDREK